MPRSTSIEVDISAYRHDFRHFLAFAIATAVGSVLFALTRKLVWGRHESLTEMGLWLLALLPYVTYFVARRLKVMSGVMASVDFIEIWTIALFAFVILHVTSLSIYYETAITEFFGLGIGSYFALSMLYVGIAYFIVTLWRTLRTHASSTLSLFASRAVGAVVGVFLFCISVFVIAF